MIVRVGVFDDIFQTQHKLISKVGERAIRVSTFRLGERKNGIASRFVFSHQSSAAPREWSCFLRLLWLLQAWL